MRFTYQYRTSGNEVRRGEVSARDREAAFAALKARGIRPAHVDEAPGIFNKLFGKGKRWIAIGVLATALTASLAAIALMGGRGRPAFEERAQLFGDPFVLGKLSADGWRTAFPDEGDAWFARHAVPGAECGCAKDEAERLRKGTAQPILSPAPVAIGRDDGDELAKMKRMVNCMKREYARYLDAGGTEAQYRIECETRLVVERQIAQRIAKELGNLERKLTPETRPQIEKAWDEKNALLRSMGLMTFPMPESDDGHDGQSRQ